MQQILGASMDRSDEAAQILYFTAAIVVDGYGFADWESFRFQGFAPSLGHYSVWVVTVEFRLYFVEDAHALHHVRPREWYAGLRVEELAMLATFTNENGGTVKR